MDMREAAVRGKAPGQTPKVADERILPKPGAGIVTPPTEPAE